MGKTKIEKTLQSSWCKDVALNTNIKNDSWLFFRGSFSNYNWMIVNLSGKIATILIATSCNENTNVIAYLTNNKKIICNQDLKALTVGNVFLSLRVIILQQPMVQ